MNRLFEESLAATRPSARRLRSGGWTPLADVYETPEGFVVQLELPGLDADDVEIQVEGDELVVRGRAPPSEPTRPESFHRMERSYGPFSRTFRFPEEVDPDRVTAAVQGRPAAASRCRRSGPGWRVASRAPIAAMRAATLLGAERRRCTLRRER